mmetsp:Transcript_146460/g.469884  ORF Transcript_146460/g.469884 Transcript_146460/m.469884 type:complete len:217 (-) Transcript_146460:93-743(-)
MECHPHNVRRVLLLWPNIVCYARVSLTLLAFALAASERASPWVVAGLYTLSMALDGLDGYLARALGQATEFGAALDVLVDNFSRAMMWSLAVAAPWGTFPPFLEMLVFACTHAEGSVAWKTGCFAKAPASIAAVMRNGFKTPLGALTIAGLHFLPLWLWLSPRLSRGHFVASPVLGATLVIGRLLAVSAELWVVFRHLGAVLERDVVARGKAIGRD